MPAFFLLCLGFGLENSEALDRQWKEEGTHGRADLAVPSGTRAGFRRVPPSETGIHFTNFLSPELMKRRSYLVNGSGVALGDVDGDGRCDLVLCGLERSPAIYRNLGGWRFEEITTRSGRELQHSLSRGAALVDLDEDGDQDLLMTFSGSGLRSWSNDGSGRFTETTATNGLSSKWGSTSMAVGDVDGDGDLDIYLANFGEISLLRDGATFSLQTVNGKQRVSGRHANRLRIVDGRLIELGEPHFLYLNQGGGRFAALPISGERFQTAEGEPVKEAGWDFGLAVQMRDMNGDGFPDIYVCNDFQTPDRFWLNDGKGNFRAASDQAVRNRPYASMGVDFGDLDRDGHLDFLVVEMLSRSHSRRLRQMSPMEGMTGPKPSAASAIDYPRNTFYSSRGDGSYAEIAYFAGLAATEWSWMPLFLDVDLDGYEDILVTNGHAQDVNDRDRIIAHAGLPPEKRSLLLYPPLLGTNLAFRNLGGFKFDEAGEEWRFNATEISHGMAAGDLDGDGDLDLVINCLNKPPLIYQNECPAPRIAVEVEGGLANRQGIGAKIKLIHGGMVQQQEIMGGGRYLSSDQPMRTFGATGVNDQSVLEVFWNAEECTRILGLKSNSLYRLRRKDAKKEVKPPIAKAPALFQSSSTTLTHQHRKPGRDWAAQPLLPHGFAELGPGMSVADLDQDGDDDLIVGNGDLSASVFYNQGGRLTWRTNLAVPGAGEMTGIVSWTVSSNQVFVFVGLNEFDPGEKMVRVARFEFVGGVPMFREILSGGPGVAGPLAAGDLDGDGRLELVAGARLQPGKFPEAGGIDLFSQHSGGAWRRDLRRSNHFAAVGLISSISLSDLTGDGRPELLAATEWGTIRIWEIEKEGFKETTSAWGLEQMHGWWNSLATVDLDGDGRLDLVAGNLGLNSPYQLPRNQPARLFYGKSGGKSPGMDLIEAYFDSVLGKVVPRRNRLALESLLAPDRPWSHGEFAQASVQEILGARFSDYRQLQANHLATTAWLNQSGRMKLLPLTNVCQWAPTFSIQGADFDNDGREDLFFGQNRTELNDDTSRLDSGRGLCLQGLDGGNFRPWKGLESGVDLSGSMRGATLADLNSDGRVDLLISQCGDQTRALINQSSRAGLRIRLAGPEGNRSGIGASIRLWTGGAGGPVRELKAGAGYWSQDSAVAVMTRPGPVDEISVLWPGGKLVRAKVPQGAKEISVSISGEATLLQ